MKTSICFIALLVFSTIPLMNCSSDNDDGDNPTLVGSWVTTDASGVEWKWEEGIINTNDPDPDMIGYEFTFTATTFTLVDFGSGTYSLDGNVVILTPPEGVDLVFDVEFDGSNKVVWQERAPTSEDQYDQHESGLLFYQKYWVMERE